MKTTNLWAAVFPLTLVLGVISFSAFMMTYFLYTERIRPVNEQKQKFNYLETIKTIGKNHPMIGLILCTLDKKTLEDMNVKLGRNADGTVDMPEVAELLNNEG